MVIENLKISVVKEESKTKIRQYPYLKTDNLDLHNTNYKNTDITWNQVKFIGLVPATRENMAAASKNTA